MSFRFKYQTILKYRQDLERNAKNDLAIAIQNQEKAKRQLKAMHIAKHEYLKSREKALKAGVTATDFRIYQSADLYYKQAIEMAKVEIKKAEEAVAEARNALQIATQEKKKMGKLKENELDLFKAEENRAEGLLVDGLVTYKTAKNNTGE